MDFLEEKREYNNILFREYHSKKNTKIVDKKYLYALLDYNYDIVSYTIVKYFKSLKYNKQAYEIGLSALIAAIENYEMDMISSFEEYVVAYIKDALNTYLESDKIMFVCVQNSGSINMGDILYNKTHDLKDTLETKKVRDSFVIKTYKKELKD